MAGVKSDDDPKIEKSSDYTGLEDAEGTLRDLEIFKAKENPVISESLDAYLWHIAKTSETLFAWDLLRPLLKAKIESVIEDFVQISPIEDVPAYPNVDSFKFEGLKTYILERLDSYQRGPPFTIQRICELLTEPMKHHKRLDKYMRALEKNLMVVSSPECFTKPPVHEAYRVNGVDFPMPILRSSFYRRRPKDDEEEVEEEEEEVEEEEDEEDDGKKAEVPEGPKVENGDASADVDVVSADPLSGEGGNVAVEMADITGDLLETSRTVEPETVVDGVFTDQEEKEKEGGEMGGKEEEEIVEVPKTVEAEAEEAPPSSSSPVEEVSSSSNAEEQQPDSKEEEIREICDVKSESEAAATSEMESSKPAEDGGENESGPESEPEPVVQESVEISVATANESGTSDEEVHISEEVNAGDGQPSHAEEPSETTREIVEEPPGTEPEPESEPVPDPVTVPVPSPVSLPVPEDAPASAPSPVSVPVVENGIREDHSSRSETQVDPPPQTESETTKDDVVPDSHEYCNGESEESLDAQASDGNNGKVDSTSTSTPSIANTNCHVLESADDETADDDGGECPAKRLKLDNDEGGKAEPSVEEAMPSKAPLVEQPRTLVTESS